MSKHVLDRRDGTAGLNRKAKEYTRAEREQGDASGSEKVKAMQKAVTEPAGDASRRVREFVKRERASD